MSLNRVIGHRNRIPWHLPEDLKWFKRLTMGQVIVMGRKTFESIGQPLPGRRTIVLSRRAAPIPGVEVVRSLEQLPEAAVDQEIFICGGAEIYEQVLPRCNDLYLTLVKREVEGDAFFPRFEDRFALIETVVDTPEFTIGRYHNQDLPAGK